MDSAGTLLRAVLADLAAEARVSRAAALLDEPDAVHHLRTTVRRQRNLLAAFRRCFEPTAAASFAAALAAYGSLLGECRDLEVRAEDATAALAALGLEELAEPVLAPLLAGHAVAHRALVAWHAGPGVEGLDALLDRWADAPPLTRRARGPADEVAAAAVRRQVRRVLARADEAVAGTEEARHGLRKAARRLRHTADAVLVVDPGAAVPGRLGHRVQSALGEHRDALLLAAHVRDSGVGASYDRVVALAEQAAARALEGLAEPLVALRGTAGS